jgi:hypothetical protein
VFNRVAFLITNARRMMIGLDHFRTLCQLLDGVHTLDNLSGKALFTSAIEIALTEQCDFREEIVGVKFAGDTPESRAAFMAKLDVERQHLEGLIAIVLMLTETQAMALLERVEDVLSTPEEIDEQASDCKTTSGRFVISNEYLNTLGVDQRAFISAAGAMAEQYFCDLTSPARLQLTSPPSARC